MEREPDNLEPGELPHYVEPNEHYVHAQTNVDSVDPSSIDYARVIAELNYNLWNPAEADKRMPVHDVTCLYLGPKCGHSACSQNYIDTGEEDCVL